MPPLLITVVYDTSVLVRVLSGRAAFSAFRQFITENNIRMLVSPYILAEAERTLYARLHLTRQKAKLAIRGLSRLADVAPDAPIQPFDRNPADAPILSLATQQKADYICSYDQDLLDLDRYGGVVILTPTRLWEQITKP